MQRLMLVMVLAAATLPAIAIPAAAAEYHWRCESWSEGSWNCCQVYEGTTAGWYCCRSNDDGQTWDCTYYSGHF